jgi:putative glutamine amidotransferase
MRLSRQRTRTRPVIGVTTQTLQAIDGIPAGLPQSDVMNQRYYIAITLVGAAPILIPLLDDEPEALHAVYDLCDGLLIPGGVDVDPSRFGEAPHPRLGRVDHARDRVELQLTKWAVDDRKPVLGLCRGLQVINVALGGTLYQDLEAQCPNGIKHDYFPTYGYERDHLAHDVTLSEGSRLRHLMELERIPVNSMHHQGIKTLASALVASAVAPDGLIEAVESPSDHFLVGVQWHPEVFEITDPHTRHVFREFIAAASASGA